MNINWKVVGVVTSVLSLGISFLGSVAEGKKTEMTIKSEAAKAVAEALANKN